MATSYELQGQYLVLKCGDQYEDLCKKTICMIKAVHDVFPNVQGLFKCDDDIIPNIKKINDLITIVNTHDINYLGYVWDLPNDYNSTWHYNKCSSASYNIPKICKKSKYAAGPLYYLNTTSIQAIVNSDVNYDDYFFEDSMVGHILNKHNIFPQHDITHTDKINDTTTNIHNCNNHKYIFVLLIGGLGNQMFQLSCAYTLAQQHNRFVVALLPKNKALIPHNTTHTEYMQNVFARFNYTYHENINMSTVTTYNEQSWYEYNPSIISQNTDYLLNGYFHHKNYFSPTIVQLFKHNDSYQILQKLFPKLGESFFIHFRLGDYLTSGNLYSFDKDKYYSTAIQYVLNIHKDAHFYILSDDISFIQTYPILNGLNKTIITDLNTVQSLYLMSLCKYGGICANSTFSGWGATLNENKNKIVICPKQWINIPHVYEIPFHYTISF